MVLVLFLFPGVSRAAEPPSEDVIFISGYWPPTNGEDPLGMLYQFMSGLEEPTQGAHGEWVIDDYRHTGYRVVMIAPKFPLLVGPDWGRGQGQWTVDYPDTSKVFWELMQQYNPVAVMTTSRYYNTKEWVLEIGAKNLGNTNWTMFSWNQGRPPFMGGATNDPARVAGRPNAGLNTIVDAPPDATRAADPTTDDVIGLKISANVEDIHLKVIDKLKLHFSEADLKPKPNGQFQGVNPDDRYVSAFAGYHALWYDAWKPSCRAGWHTHVGFGISVADASEAIKLQLDVMIQWLDEN